MNYENKKIEDVLKSLLLHFKNKEKVIFQSINENLEYTINELEETNNESKNKILKLYNQITKLEKELKELRDENIELKMKSGSKIDLENISLKEDLNFLKKQNQKMKESMKSFSELLKIKNINEKF